MSKPLENRIILVTGASNGIGKTAAIGLAQAGATIILHGKNERALNKVYDEIIALDCPRPAIVPIDFKKAPLTVYDELADYLTQEFGRLDGLLHNAAFLGSITPIEHYPYEQWQEVFQINVNVPFVLTKALLPLLKQSSDASIVFTSADVGRQAKALWGAYAASKHAVEGLMQTLAAELAENTAIRVNSFNPVRVRTDLRAKVYPGETPFDNPEPESLVSQYIYLLGPESHGITGKQLTAQGVSA